VSKRGKMSYIQSVKETKQLRIHSKTQKQTSITIKSDHEPRMVETSQGCKVHSNSQVFRFVFTLKAYHDVGTTIGLISL